MCKSWGREDVCGCLSYLTPRGGVVGGGVGCVFMCVSGGGEVGSGGL